MLTLTLSSCHWLGVLTLTKCRFKQRTAAGCYCGQQLLISQYDFSVVRLAKRSARQSASAASIATTSILQAAEKKLFAEDNLLINDSYFRKSIFAPRSISSGTDYRNTISLVNTSRPLALG